MNYIRISLFFLVGIFLTACSDLSLPIKKNEVVIEKIDINDTVKKPSILSEQEIKIKALQWLEDAYDHNIYLDKFISYVDYIDSTWMSYYSKEYINKVLTQFSKKEIEDVKNGYYIVTFVNNEIRSYNKGFKLALSAKTGDVLKFDYYPVDGSNTERIHTSVDSGKTIIDNFIQNIEKTPTELVEKKEAQLEYQPGYLYTYKNVENELLYVFIFETSPKINYYAKGVLSKLEGI